MTITDAAPAPTEPAARPSGERARRARAHARFAGPIVALVLGMKLLTYTLGVYALETIKGRSFHGVGERLSFWNFWDSSNYLSIAAHGYQTTGEAAHYIVFFPGYPYAVRFASWLLPGDMLTAAFVVSGVASVAAALLLAHLVRIDTGDDARAQRAAWFLLIFPTAYFLHIPYTEGLFLTFVLGSFVAARNERWALAGVIGLLAALTRINGVLLLPALAVEAYLQFRRTGRIARSWLWLGLVPLGLLVYLGINQHYFGDAFHFQDVQQQVW
ncbi:MAG: mannosyltransferase family protein, partial [Patulibacter sp.]|nr:mannosyltransferase family protein [Patulibacter sp.]